MKPAKRNAGSENEFRVSASGEISADNYGERAAAFIRGCSGKGYVIRAIEGHNGSLATKQPATEPQWFAWIAYFRVKEIPHQFVLSNGMATVPSEWPENFDYDAPVSDRTARLKPPRAPASEEQRALMKRRLLALADRMTTKDRHAKRFNVGDMSAPLAASHLVELQAKYTKTKCAPLGVYVEPERFVQAADDAPPDFDDAPLPESPPDASVGGW